MGLKWGRQPLWIGGWTITCPGCWWRGSWKIPISSFEVHISRLCITTGQPTVWGGEALVYGVHWLSVLVLRIRDAEAGGGPFAFCVLDGRQLLIYKKCKSTPPPPIVRLWWRSCCFNVWLRDTSQGGLTDRPQEAVHRAKPWSSVACPSELAWCLTASTQAQLMMLCLTVFIHWFTFPFLIGLPESWAMPELTILRTLLSRCIICSLPLLTVYFLPKLMF